MTEVDWDCQDKAAFDGKGIVTGRKSLPLCPPLCLCPSVALGKASSRVTQTAPSSGISSMMKAPESHRYEGLTLSLGWGGHSRSPPGEAAGLSTMTGRGRSWREAFSAITETGVQEARTHYL